MGGMNNMMGGFGANNNNAFAGMGGQPAANNNNAFGGLGGMGNTRFWIGGLLVWRVLHSICH
jgi:hypothetical protein